MSILLLVRHGQASWGTEDYDRLSELGEQQARVLGAALSARGLRPDLLVRGGMLRHRQTAAAAVEAAGWDGEVVEDVGWDEYDHVSTLTGARDLPEVSDAPYDERVRLFEAKIDRWASGEHDADYHESFPVFRDRVDEAFRRTVARLEPKQTAVVFTSGGAVSWVAASLTHGGVPAWSRLSKVMMNGGVTKVLDGRRGTSLISFNDHSHLEAAGSELLSYR
jgi:broad specificity phosphatase PhoE